MEIVVGGFGMRVKKRIFAMFPAFNELHHDSGYSGIPFLLVFFSLELTEICYLSALFWNTQRKWLEMAQNGNFRWVGKKTAQK